MAVIDNNEEQITIDIHGEVFDKDFDDVGWEPEVIDDTDEESQELYGY